jgi:hypothetical protein
MGPASAPTSTAACKLRGKVEMPMISKTSDSKEDICK